MIQTKVFGSIEGQEILAVTISNGGLAVTVTTLGATIQKIMFAGTDLCLGYDTPREYLDNDGYFGASIGRCGNRIGGSTFTIHGTRYHVTPNEGKNQLHGGVKGFDKKIWSYRAEGENTAVFSCTSPDGEEGFPGNMQVEVRYSVDELNGLTLDYQAVSDKDTIANLTNHCYFNLNGAGSGDVLGHIMQINASCYVPADCETIPTGEIRSVEGTALDFRTAKPIGRDIHDAELVPFKGYDLNMAVDGSGLRQIAGVMGEKTGIKMTVSTTLEGLQLYTGNFISDRIGKEGKKYSRHGAFCMETQHYPDAVNHANFPSPVLKAGEKYHEITVYRFAK